MFEKIYTNNNIIIDSFIIHLLKLNSAREQQFIRNIIYKPFKNKYTRKTKIEWPDHRRTAGGRGLVPFWVFVPFSVIAVLIKFPHLNEDTTTEKTFYVNNLHFMQQKKNMFKLLNGHWSQTGLGRISMFLTLCTQRSINGMKLCIYSSCK